MIKQMDAVADLFVDGFFQTAKQANAIAPNVNLNLYMTTSLPGLERTDLWLLSRAQTTSRDGRFFGFPASVVDGPYPFIQCRPNLPTLFPACSG